jgi:hypothetical protein
MPASKKRKGHNKRIQQRRNEMKALQKTYQKMLNSAMKTHLEELKSNSGKTDNIFEETK